MLGLAGHRDWRFLAAETRCAAQAALETARAKTQAPFGNVVDDDIL
jgi:hypothetical protein